MFSTLESVKSHVSDILNISNISCININTDIVSNQIFERMSSTMKIDDFYTLLTNVCDDMSSLNLEYSELGAWVLYIQAKEKTDSMGLDNFVIKTNYINSNLTDFLNRSYVEFINSNQDFVTTLITSVPSIPKYLDLFGYKTLDGSYLIKVNSIPIEQPADMFLRVAIAIHFRSDNPLESIKSTFLNLYSGYYTHATPTLYNAGTNYEQLSSCFLLGTEDSLEGIFKTCSDTGKISKWSGGVGIHISNIRAKGSKIRKTNGDASGIIPMLKLYNDIARYINQGGRGKKRPGAIAIYLEPWHADVLEFLELKLNTGADELRTRDLFLALWIPDLFMKQLEIDGDWYLMCPDTSIGLSDVYGDEFEKLYWSYVESGKYIEKIKASDILVKITKSLAESGVPYILFKDHINKKSNQKNIGTIKSSNLCVHEDTMIFTKIGYQNIKLLKDQDVEIWNGYEWSKVVVRQTGSNQNLIRVNLSNGTFLDCTPEHKFYTQIGHVGKKEKMASELSIGDKLIKLILPGPIDVSVNYIETTLKLLEDIFNSNGKKIYNGNNESLQIMNINKEYLINIRYTLHTLGIESKINSLCNQKKIHDYEKCWELLINPLELNKLIYLGFSPNKFQFKFQSCKSNINIEEFITVESVTKSFQNTDTYCFTEPIRHMGVFNGILTGQCTEITEVSSDTEYAVCNLGSIAVNKFYSDGVYNYDHLRLIAYELTVNLNNVIDINYYPTPETFKTNSTARPIGVGIQGMSDLLLLLRLPYESDAALEIESKVMETIYYGALQASIDLAKKLGPYTRFEGSPFSQGKFQHDLGYQVNRELMWNWDELRTQMIKFGTRNSLLTSLMPTASTSQILGNMECFEPITSNIYTRKTAVGTYKVVNKYLVNDLIKLNLWNESMKNKIVLANGSIQNITEIPREFKELYKTIWEIKQKSIIDHALVRQPFVDQSQSMNLYFDKIDIGKVKNSIFYGWKRGIKTGCYYMRSNAASTTSTVVQVNNQTDNVPQQVIEECAMCSA